MNDDLAQFFHAGHVFKQEFLVKDDKMLANMKREVDTLGLRWGSSLNFAWPTPNRPPGPRDMAAVYAVIPTGTGGQDEGLELRDAVLRAQRVLQVLSMKYPGLFLVKLRYVRATSNRQQLWHLDFCTVP